MQVALSKTILRHPTNLTKCTICFARPDEPLMPRQSSSCPQALWTKHTHIHTPRRNIYMR